MIHLSNRRVLESVISSIDIPFSIDEIKGTGTEKKEEKKTRKKAEPKEKFTTDHLIQEKGIPELIRNGGKLRLKDQRSIVLRFI